MDFISRNIFGFGWKIGFGESTTEVKVFWLSNMDAFREGRFRTGWLGRVRGQGR